MDADDGLAVDTKEVAGVELALYLFQCHGDAEKAARGQIEPCVLVFGTDMADVVYRHQFIAILIGDEEALSSIVQR